MVLRAEKERENLGHYKRDLLFSSAEKVRSIIDKIGKKVYHSNRVKINTKEIRLGTKSLLPMLM